MSILNLLRSDGSINVNKHLAREIGLHEAIILSELISWHMYYTERGETDADGMFFVTIEKLEHNTTLKKDTQNRLIKKLINQNLISTKQKGLPAKRYFWINEQAITDMVMGARSGTAPKLSQNEKADNGAGSELQKSEKPRRVQLSQNEKAEVRKMRNVKDAFCETINTKYINTKNNTDFEEEEEESPPTPSAFPAKLLERDIQAMTQQYPQYKKVTEDIGANATKDCRPVFSEEEFFLECAASIPVHPETLWDVYQTIRPEIDRSVGFRYVGRLIATVFSRFGEHLAKGRINFDAASWFKMTWLNERIAIEQREMLRKQNEE